MQNANLVPEAQWKQCQRCKTAVPEFEFSAPFQTEVQAPLKNSPVRAIVRVIQEANCDPSLAKAWMIHLVPSHLNEHPHCPHCGMPLRTSKARQCRFCGKDWH
jgi:hypothetical protein